MNDQEAKLFLQQIRNVSKNETQSNTKTCIKTTPAYVISVNGQMATVRLVTDLTGANPFNVPIITSQTISPGDYANLAYWDNLSTAVIFSGGNNYPVCPNIPIRPNLIDNACFVGGGTGWGVFPVNQQGQTSYGAGFAFDRWRLNGGTCTLKPSGVSWDAGFVLYQVMDGLNLADGKARTVSYVDENHRGFSGVLTASYTAIGNYSFTYDTGTSLYMLGHADAPAIAWVKLEEGENQTLYAENGDGTVTVLPQGLNYQQELAKCQAYLWRGSKLHFHAYRSAGFNAVIQIPLPVPMRVDSPAVTIDGLLISSTGASEAITPIKTYGATSGILMVETAVSTLEGTFVGDAQVTGITVNAEL